MKSKFPIMLRYRVLGPMCDGVGEERRSEEKSCASQLSTLRAEAGGTRANVGDGLETKMDMFTTWAWVQTTEK
jgi:hypothetical protein